VNATGVTAGPAESNGRLLLGVWCDSLHVTCGLTACTPGSAPGPTLGNEYGKTLPFYLTKVEVVWFHTLVSDQSLALLHVLCISYLVADNTFGLGLNFESLVSAKDK